MRRLSRVQARTLATVVVAVLLLVPGWSGLPRLPLLDPATSFRVTARPDLRGSIGPLRVVAAWELSGSAPGFGGFSALAVRDGVVTLLSDGGNFVRLGRAGHAAGSLAAGPGVGWQKRERDSEALTVHGDHAWVAFERANAIWRYDAGLARSDAMAQPVAMRDWSVNGGAEALVRLPDGRFVALAEDPPKRGKPRVGLLFSGDPTAASTRVARFAFVPPPRYSPSDAAALPNGDLLVLTRRYRPPLTFSAKLVLVPRAELRVGATARGRVLATLAVPRYGYNWEGLAVTVEAGRPVLWLVNDNDNASYRRSLLLKMVVAGHANGPPRERRAVR